VFGHRCTEIAVQIVDLAVIIFFIKSSYKMNIHDVFLDYLKL